jgi:hypothetical protein
VFPTKADPLSRFSRLFLVQLVTALPCLTAHAITVSIDANTQVKPINPHIYGVAHAESAAQLSDLNVPLQRWGGNVSTTCNWQNNTCNRANDWYFESIGTGGTPGADADNFISSSKSAGAEPMMTIPMMDWVAKIVTPDAGNNGGRTWSFDTQKYGAQQFTAPDIPNGRAGNGVSAATGQPLTGNDPNDAYVPAGVNFQQGWVQHIVGRFGLASAGGLRYYILDNEHAIWHATHRDIKPIGAHDTEIRDKMLAYSAMIHAQDPSAKVVGPEEWGWSGYFYSGFDSQTQTWGNLPDHDQAGHGDYMPWLLRQFKQRDDANPTLPRTLDVFTLHYYPQGGEYGNDTSAAMQARRNRSTRSLWDPSYTDESWIGSQVQLVPRMRNWVNTHYYSGTPIGITEYSWGAETHINGATTQADVLGIFGREGLDMATYWTVPSPSGPAYKAIKMYRNYDGNKSTFGNMSVSAVTATPDILSAFAARRASDNALTVMVINKVTASNPLILNLANFIVAGAVQIWQLTASNQITRLADAAVSANALNTTVPAQSITLFVIPGSGLPPPPSGSACDINGDTTTNVSDVQLCANQAIGAIPCSAGDINHDSACNVIDVQRVVNAALGGACATQ